MRPSFPLPPRLSSLQQWNQLIQASTRNRCFSQSLHLYSSMLATGLHGDAFTFPFVAKACAQLGSIWDGRKLHAHTVALGFQANTFVQTSLLDMYSKCSAILDSHQLFVEMPHTSLVSWNCMISAYCRESEFGKSIELFNGMRRAGIKPSSSTLTALVSGCVDSVAALRNGLAIFCYGFKVLFGSDMQLSNSILSMFVRFGLIDDARLLFDCMDDKSVVSWTAMASGYVQIGDSMEVLNLFNQMRKFEHRPDSVALLNLVSASLQLGHLLIASSVYALALQSGLDHGHVLTSLLNVYASCKDLVSAQKIFDSVPKKSVFLWTAMISGCVRSGHFGEAFALFKNLLSSTIKPNEATISTILSACADFGSIAIGESAEEYILANGLQSDIRVQTGLIRMYCKCGNIERARKKFDDLSTKDLTAWSTMINGYACHGRGKEALAVFEEMQKEENIMPDAVLFSHLLSACSHSGLVVEGLKCFNSLQLDYGIEPTIEHYTCVVDLLSKAGHIDQALRFVHEIPFQLQNKAWTPLLSALRAQQGIQVRLPKEVLKLEVQDTGHYVLVANLHSYMGEWNEAAVFRSLISKRDLIKEPGWSRLEVS